MDDGMAIWLRVREVVEEGNMTFLGWCSAECMFLEEDAYWMLEGMVIVAVMVWGAAGRVCKV